MYDITKKIIQGWEDKNHFSNCKMFSAITEGRLLAINDKFLAIPWEKQGKICIVNSNYPTNFLYAGFDTFTKEESTILDMEFSPFNSNILAFSNENKSVILAKIKYPFDYESDKYQNHTKKVNFVNFNPLVLNIMLSCTGDGEFNVWDSNKLETIVEYNIGNSPSKISWSPNGDLIGISQKDKDKTFSVYDPRSQKISFSFKRNDSNFKFDWIDNNSIATIGTDSNGNKFLRLIDFKRSNNPYSTIKIDSNSFQINPFVDPELKLIYAVGKEEKKIKVFDYCLNLKKCFEVNCQDNILSSILMNRRYLNKNKKEIDRVVIYTKNKNIYYVGFYDKNISDKINIENLYPNKDLSKKQITSAQWLNKMTPINITEYKRPFQNSYKIQYQNSLKKNEQNSADIYKKSISNNINNVQIIFSNKNLKINNKNEDIKKNNPPSSLSAYNKKKIEQECSNCINFQITLKELENEKKKLIDEIDKFKRENNNYSAEISKLKKKNNDSYNELKQISNDYKII